MNRGMTILGLMLLSYAMHANGPRAEDKPVASPGAAVRLKFSLPEHDLYPENIAFDPVSDDFLIGSMGRSCILRIHPDGAYEEFLADSVPELLSSVGLKVDARRRRLWVCTGRFSLLDHYAGAPARTGLLRFDLDSGKLTGQWLLEQAGDYHIFNDLTIARDGTVYATSTLMGGLYRIDAGKDEMVCIHQLPAGSHNNGVVLSPDERFLFLTVDRSIRRFELATATMIEVPVPGGEALGGDGLYFLEGSLVLVKPRLNKVSQLYLNEDLSAVVGVKTLADGHPDFAYPTTGVIVGDKLILVSTSYADVPRNPDADAQHGDVLIHEISLAE